MLTKPMSQEKLVKFSRSEGLVGGPFSPPGDDELALAAPISRSSRKRGLSKRGG